MRTALFAALLIIGPLAAPMPVASAPVWTGILGNQPALDGHDSVSYFSGKPLRGDNRFTAQYKGATFKFANAANLASFKANPARFAPQYGGHCAWAAAGNYRFAGDPAVWRIVDGKLYLNYNRDVQAKWEKDIPGLVKKGDINWVALGK